MGAHPIGWVEVGSYLDWTWETWVMVRGSNWSWELLYGGVEVGMINVGLRLRREGLGCGFSRD